ncbi:hypothetical protein BJ508DRAFT_362817 [Ascobolus immersus RN42]|uniref:Uncharacterized protein n=1 Tax=Ascobolus immersus RN42 TaxID=1160509 RepID=A0A3N4I7E8_ASCIM|nr:hypothetical protein BJ508DRAFT_362817 [Ascobolus immersus RN42]
MSDRDAIHDLPTPSASPEPGSEPCKLSHEAQIASLTRDLDRIILTHCNETLEVDKRFTAVDARFAALERRLYPLIGDPTQDGLLHEGLYYRGGPTDLDQVERRVEARVATDLGGRIEGWLRVVEGRILGIEKAVRRIEGVLESLEERIEGVEGEVAVTGREGRRGSAPY